MFLADFEDDMRYKTNLIKSHSFKSDLLRFGCISNVTCETFNNHLKLENVTAETVFKVSVYDKW